MSILLILLYVWLGLGLLITVVALTAIHYDFKHNTFDGEIKSMWIECVNEGVKETSLNLPTDKLECPWWLFGFLVVVTSAIMLFGRGKE